MTAPLRFSLVLHNHQPVGNFDDVFQRAYEQSYRPFLDVFEPYSQLRIALHTSGSLIEWLDRHQSEYLDRIAALAEQGRIEVVGGAFYEPILSMLPSRDRIGQIRSYTEFLKARLGATVRGMWVAERVWEPSLVRDLADAGIEYTLLDDFHFRSAGLSDASLRGYYLTEDDGRLLAVFPGSERLRYIIPFGDPSETIRYLGDISDRFPGAVVTFADDGEKFGTWPETYKHVYEEGWLRRFFDALVENASWLSCTTPSEILENRPPLGKVYLPDASYREMTEWALPADQLIEYEQVRHELEHDPRWPKIAPRIRGGLWRNFKVKYPESDEMYARMMQVSRRLAQTSETEADAELLRLARTELYRGQCNCSYWHGAFGGIYLPHLRNAVYNHLIAADNLLDRAIGRSGSWAEVTAEDYNFDGRQEARLASDRLSAWLAPAAGGQMVELDVRSICHNLLATLSRRPEAYHQKVRGGATAPGEHVASIHDRVVFKQQGLDQQLQYDTYARKSLIDHFLGDDATLDDVAAGRADERGDFIFGRYEAQLLRNPGRVQVRMVREGTGCDVPLKITKAVTLEAGGNVLEIAYRIDGLPKDRTLHFAVEFGFAGLPADADDRYFYDADRKPIGQLGTRLDLTGVHSLGLVDKWLGVDVGLSTNRPTNFWTFPIAAVSQSEGGYELVHQSVVVLPHWHVEADENGSWTVRMHMAVDTSLAESRMEEQPVAAAGL